MTKCPKCGFELKADATECPSCGLALEQDPSTDDSDRDRRPEEHPIGGAGGKGGT
jgi:hypothetical protein